MTHPPPRLRLLALALCSAALAACHKQQPQQGFQRPPAPVTVAAAISRDVPVYLDEIGKCVATEVVTVQPQVSGQLIKSNFEEGGYVKAGEPLFTIDPRPFQAQLNAAEATLLQQRATLDLANINFARVKGLVESKAISQQEYDNARNAVDVTTAQVKQAEAAVETAKLNLEYCQINSPISGRTGQRLVDIGNIVTANMTPLVNVQRLDPIYAEFTVTEHDLTDVQHNMANGPLHVEIRLPDEPAAPTDGELTFLDNTVQQGTGTVKLRATAKNPDHRLWPGRFVKVRLVLRTLKDAVLIPADAPQLSANGPFVYVIHPDGTAELRPITPGQRQGNLLVVDKGLKAGEQVVTVGQLGVVPGGKVNIVKPAAESAAETPAESNTPPTAQSAAPANTSAPTSPASPTTKPTK